MLECRTDGRGATWEHALEELKALDVGYGYTADDGRTWPFRGKGIGLMPSLAEVMATFPERDFLIDVKSNNPSHGALLAEQLVGINTDREGEIMVTGGVRSVGVISEHLPHIRTTTRPQIGRCVLRYMALGWSGYVPIDCEHTVLMVPGKVAPWLWGWPNRFLQRMDEAGTLVLLTGDYWGTGPTRPFDDPHLLLELPSDYSGGIFTNRIDLIGPAVRDGLHFTHSVSQ